MRANVAKLGAKADIRAQSVMALGPAAAPLDVIMMDPPYGTGAGVVALDRLARLGWVGPATWVSIESQRNEPVELAGFVADADKIYGKARVTILRGLALPNFAVPGEGRGPVGETIMAGGAGSVCDPSRLGSRLRRGCRWESGI